MIRPALALSLLLSGAALAQEDDLLARAEAGDAAAQAALAFQYHEGRSVVQNFAAAADWAARAAEAGDARAANLLGRYYHSGLGVGRDQAQAIRWLKAAAAGGDPQFLHDLGQALENGADGGSDPARAAEVYARAAQAGHAGAAVSLGVLYQDGRGVERDYARARALYAPHAEAGQPRAQNNLGLLYVRGHGVPQDYERAARLFAAAAEQGLPDALRNLGVMYENGFGVALDEARAAALYRQAGQAGPAAPGLRYDARLAPPPSGPEARAALERMAAAGDPVAEFQLAWLLAGPADAPFLDLARAARLFAAGAEAGHGPSMLNLGVMHFEGRGVAQDYVLGRMWLLLAAAAGQTEALALAQTLGAAMTPAQVNEAQTLATSQKNP